MISELVPSSLPSPSAPTVTDIGAGGDGIHAEDGLWRVCSEWADLSEHPVEEIDECFSPVRGASAIVQDCVFEGAEKICLVGCGDIEWRPLERGKWVVFENCTFRRGSRRMPEVQSGMSVLMLNCVIENWCLPSRQPLRPARPPCWRGLLMVPDQSVRDLRVFRLRPAALRPRRLHAFH